MHLILALDTSLSMFKRKSEDKSDYADVAIEGISQFIEYTSDGSESVIEIASAIFSRELEIVSKFALKEDQDNFAEILKTKIKEHGPGGRCLLVENIKKLEEMAKNGLGDDSFLDLFLITDKVIDEKMQTELLSSLDDQTRIFVFSFAEDRCPGSQINACGSNDRTNKIETKTEVTSNSPTNISPNPSRHPSSESNNENSNSLNANFLNTKINNEPPISSIESKIIGDKIFIDFIKSDNDKGFTISEDMGEKMIHRYTTQIAELVVSINLGQLQDNCTLFPQPRVIQVKQNGSFNILGFLPMKTLLGLPIISRHVLVPRGRQLDEPHLLHIMYQAQKDSVAFVKYENQFGFICAMNYITTSTMGDSQDLNMCLLLVNEVPWLGKLENLTPNIHLFLHPQSRDERMKYLILNPDLDVDAVLKNPTILFPVKAGHGAFGENRKKSYAVPGQAQLWKNEAAINTDCLKLSRLAKKIPADDSKNKQFVRDLNKFKKQAFIFGIQDQVLPKLLQNFQEIVTEREMQQKEAYENAKKSLLDKLSASNLGDVQANLQDADLLPIIVKLLPNENDNFVEKLKNYMVWNKIVETLKNAFADKRTSCDDIVFDSEFFKPDFMI